MYSAVSSMPLAATGLVICWNLPMNRPRSSHSSVVAIGVSWSSRRSMKSKTSVVTAGVRRFALRTASVMKRRSCALTGRSAVT